MCNELLALHSISAMADVSGSNDKINESFFPHIYVFTGISPADLHSCTNQSLSG